eukprot:6027020-Prymnesium_polylepis.1
MKLISQLEASEAWSDERIQELEQTASTLQYEAEQATKEMEIIGMEKESLEGLLIDEKHKTAPKRGRPAGHRGSDFLEE